MHNGSLGHSYRHGVQPTGTGNFLLRIMGWDGEVYLYKRLGAQEGSRFRYTHISSVGVGLWLVLVWCFEYLLTGMKRHIL